MEFCIKTFDNLEIRELYDILALRAEVFVVEQNCPYCDVDGRDKKAWQIIGTANGEIVAGLRILQKRSDSENIAIGRVMVAKAYRKQGVAQQMLARALDFIRNELMEQEVVLSAQTYAMALYENAGFKAVSNEYLEDGIPHIDMKIFIP